MCIELCARRRPSKCYLSIESHPKPMPFVLDCQPMVEIEQITFSVECWMQSLKLRREMLFMMHMMHFFSLFSGASEFRCTLSGSDWYWGMEKRIRLIYARLMRNGEEDPADAENQKVRPICWQGPGCRRQLRLLCWQEMDYSTSSQFPRNQCAPVTTPPTRVWCEMMRH